MESTNPPEPEVKIRDLLPNDYGRIFVLSMIRAYCKKNKVYIRTSKMGYGIDDTEETLIRLYDVGMIKFFSFDGGLSYQLLQWNGYKYEKRKEE
ncbi:hypothetical protein LCGC14_2263900 [marine sediment metagenome]|uniref:Uncharacterized protein n=1 Tax=marine sediment metagenome TaxID=412755 RepID=A0A0F9CZ43_9ZZZZ